MKGIVIGMYREVIKNKELEPYFIKYVHSLVLFTLSSRLICDAEIRTLLLHQMTQSNKELTQKIDFTFPQLSQDDFVKVCDHYVKKHKRPTVSATIDLKFDWNLSR